MIDIAGYYRYEIYTDGSLRPATARYNAIGAWAAVIMIYCGNEQVNRRIVSGSVDEPQSSHQLEALAIYHALRHLGHDFPINVYTDSKTVIEHMKNPRTKSTKKLRSKMRGKQVNLIHIIGHSGNIYNEMAHQAAYDAAKNAKRSRKARDVS